MPRRIACFGKSRRRSRTANGSIKKLLDDMSEGGDEQSLSIILMDINSKMYFYLQMVIGSANFETDVSLYLGGVGFVLKKNE